MHGTLTANFRAASSSVAYTHLFTPQMTRAVRNKPLCESMDSGRSLQLTAIMVSVCIVDNGLGSNCIYTILSSPQEGANGGNSRHGVSLHTDCQKLINYLLQGGIIIIR